MKKIQLIWSLLVLSLLAVSCIKDDTTIGDGAISRITIDSTSVCTEYNINKNDELVITPKVSQSNRDKELSYTWEIDLKPVSNDPVFTYKATQLGTYRARLIVENADGKSFFNFTINVNTPYEEGLALISKDKNGNGKLSFMLFTPDGKPTSFTKDDCFKVNNPDFELAGNPSDIVQSSGSLIMACQGGADNGVPATIYYLNEKTLVVENHLTAPEYPDFKPSKLVIPSQGAWGVAYPVLCENGKVYEFSTTEGALAEPVKLPYTYSQSTVTYDDGTPGNYYLLFWEKETNALCFIYRGYGPYFCSREYLLDRKKFIEKNEVDPTINYFNAKQFVRMDLIHKTKSQLLKGNSEVLILTKGMISMKVRIQTDLWTYNPEDGTNVLVDNGGFSAIGYSDIPVDENTPAIANDTYKSFIFADGTKIRRWNYTSNQLITDADVLLELDSPTAVITDFEISADHKTTYVAFYEPDQEGDNGSVWAFDTDKGTVLQRYDHVCYQPMKLFYKKK